MTNWTNVPALCWDCDGKKTNESGGVCSMCKGRGAIIEINIPTGGGR